MKDKFACRSLAFVFLLSLPVSFNACGGGGGESDASEVLSELCVDGNSCDDGDPCTHSDQCNNGVCSGVVYDCIALPCAAPECDGNGGCVYKPYAGWCLIDSVCVEESSLNSKNQCEGCDPAKDNLVWTKLSSVSCNDGDVCTVKDTCVEGVCLGEAKDCGDDNDCTDDNCEAGIGCVHEYLQGACDDGDPCTVGDGCSEDGVCVSGLEQEICDDKNPCTYDVCEPFAGCQFIDDVKLACGDDNPCTMETCKPQEGCKHTPVAGECDDGNECTGGDFCEKGECKPGPDVVVCDDKNPCTYDLCNPDKGCVASFTQDNCNDNYSCTLNDKCMGGKCTGEKIISLCQTCEPEFGEFVQKMTTISLGNGGFKGLGLDIDGNPDTCAPYDNCSGGIDNELGKLGYAVNEAIIESVSQGYTTYLTELSGFNTGGFVFTLNLLYGDIAAGYENCDFQKEKCKYELSALNFDPECKPVISMDNAVAKDGVIKAGGKGYIFPLKSSLVGGGEMSMVIYNAAIEAEYILDSGGTGIESLNGVIGGAVNKQELMDTLTELPDWFFPYDKQAVLDLLEEMIIEDIDVEGDGINDAASIGIRFSTIQGEIVGLYN